MPERNYKPPRNCKIQSAKTQRFGSVEKQCVLLASTSILVLSSWTWIPLITEAWAHILGGVGVEGGVSYYEVNISGVGKHARKQRSLDLAQLSLARDLPGS